MTRESHNVAHVGHSGVCRNDDIGIDCIRLQEQFSRSFRPAVDPDQRLVHELQLRARFYRHSDVQQRDREDNRADRQSGDLERFHEGSPAGHHHTAYPVVLSRAVLPELRRECSSWGQHQRYLMPMQLKPSDMSVGRPTDPSETRSKTSQSSFFGLKTQRQTLPRPAAAACGRPSGCSVLTAIGLATPRPRSSPKFSAATPCEISR